ncbi:MAG: aminotransferase class IV [Bacteroidota bacterium]|nr:aminotransferase class IV [Bacteroidota bacterium]
MRECFRNWFLLNGSPESCENFSSSRIYSGESVYEVIRIINGVPLFFEDHIKRLKDTAKVREKSIPFESQEIRNQILQLVELNHSFMGNVKLVCNYSNSGKKSPDFLVYFIEHHYPSQNQYSEGVSALLFFAERDYPSAKIINQKLRSVIFKKLIDTGVYEAVLVDQQGFITEGSRSNVFFVKDEKVFTAPDGTVLSGIARKYILQSCSDQNIELSFERVHYKKIRNFDAAFISGTSPGLLPLNEIGSLKMECSSNIIKVLTRAYNTIVNRYIVENGN